MPFQIACQTITFGPKQFERFPEVFAAVRRAGYTGVETGYRHVASFPPEEMKTMLGDQGLELAASHMGGNLEETQRESGRPLIDEVLDYLDAMGTARLMYSGLKYQDDDQFARALEMVGRAAVKCRERGVHLLYHNHWYEFSDGWRGMNAIIERGDEALGFCPDVGWVHKGGADVIEFLDKIKGRVGALHYKDFLTNDLEQKDFCTLGEGVTPFEAVTDWARANTPDLWIIAEQDKSDLTPEEAVTRNADYLKRAVLA